MRDGTETAERGEGTGGEASCSTALSLLTPAALALRMYRPELDVRVDEGARSIRFAPLYRKSTPLADIASSEPRTCRPIADFGGWGIR